MRLNKNWNDMKCQNIIRVTMPLKSMFDSFKETHPKLSDATIGNIIVNQETKEVSVDFVIFENNDN